MHRMHNQPRTNSGLETSGSTIHWASQYDIFTSLMGLGVNRPNSKMVIDLAKIKTGDKVLDVGCGTGNLTLTAKQHVGASGSVYGIDASLEMIDVAQKKAKKLGSETIFEVGLIEQLSYPDATFDIVISRLVIHHLPDDLKHTAFTEILRVLKAGGHLLVADFNPLKNPILNHITTALVGSHLMQTNVWHISQMLTEAGFVEVASGLTRSVFLAYVYGKKPVS